MRGGVAGGGELPRISEACLYSHLLTRPTGRAVRMGIEQGLVGQAGSVLTLVDFRNVAIIDFSCADEVVAKLAHAALARTSPPLRFYLFTGLEEHHLDPVESALRRRALAVTGERADGTPCLLGEADGRLRRPWALVGRLGRATPVSLVPSCARTEVEARRLLEELHARRLLLRRAGEYLSLRAAASATAGGGPR
jgi:hypothetical protein